MLIQGIDPQLFHPTGEEPDDERFILFSGGKFELRKGQDLVLRAFKALQDKYPDLWLVNCWYNLWPESMRLMESSRHIRFEAHAGPWQEVMRRTYALNGLDASRIVTCDLMSPELLPELYRHTHLGVFPNRCEGGTNLVLMEYMACGRPAIVSYASGHTDVVTESNALLAQGHYRIPRRRPGPAALRPLVGAVFRRAGRPDRVRVCAPRQAQGDFPRCRGKHGPLNLAGHGRCFDADSPTDLIRTVHAGDIRRGAMNSSFIRVVNSVTDRCKVCTSDSRLFDVVDLHGNIDLDPN